MAGAGSVAVVIPSWNGLADLRGCLASIEAQDDVEVELLVVDNGSTDGTGEYLDSAGIANIRLPQNAGFAAAVNLGAGRTVAPAVMVLNADAALVRGALGALVRALEADRGLGGVQPRILEPGSGGAADVEDPAATVYSSGQFLTADGRGYERDAGRRQGDRPIVAAEVFGVCGAACLLRRELFSDLGGYDERYFAFCEDVDLNVRARIAGWRFALVPEAVAWHRGGGAWSSSFASPAADNARLVARNRLATQLKFVPLAAWPRIAAVEAGALARAARLRRLRATAAGKLEALRWLPDLLRERRRLRAAGDVSRARAWLGAGGTRPVTARGRAAGPPTGRR